VFFPYKCLQASLIKPGQELNHRVYIDRLLLSECLELIRKHKTTLLRFAGKHSSLFCLILGDEEKSFMFPSKAGAYPSRADLRCHSLWQTPRACTIKHYRYLMYGFRSKLTFLSMPVDVSHNSKNTLAYHIICPFSVRYEYVMF
jgi:hypothetical protein